MATKAIHVKDYYAASIFFPKICITVPNLWACSFWFRIAIAIQAFMLGVSNLGRKWQTKKKHVIQSGSRFPLCKKLWTWGRGSIKKQEKLLTYFYDCPVMQKLDKAPTMKIICPHKKANQFLRILIGRQLTNEQLNKRKYFKLYIYRVVCLSTYLCRRKLSVRYELSR